MTLPRKLLFSAVATVLGLVLMEGSVRLTSDTVARASIPAKEILAHVQSTGIERDPLLGWKHSPLPDPSNGINALGWRYPVEPELTHGGWRAFAMGDSQTYGAGVAWDQAYPAIAEGALRAQDPQAQVINAACSGYGSLQAFRQIRDQLAAYAPDLYIVDARPHDQPQDQVVPPVDGVLQRLLFHSRVYYLMRVGIEDRRQQTERMGKQRRENEHTGNHRAIVNLAAQQGVAVLFVDYPFWNQNGNEIRCLATADRLPWQAPVAQICEALKADPRDPRQLFFDANHMSAEGSKVAGLALAKEIQRLGLGPGGAGWTPTGAPEVSEPMRLPPPPPFQQPAEPGRKR